MKQVIRDGYSTYLENTDSKPRHPQRQMIGSIATALNNVYDGQERPQGYHTPIITIQGPTGVGKTLSYLLSTIPMALSLHKKVVLSTATVALQEQLFQKDLPAVHQHSGLEFDFKLAKGRRRYCCPNRLVKHVSNSDPTLFEDSDRATPADKSLFKTLATAFSEQQWDGDIDSWDEQIDALSWNKISTDASGCTSRHCSHFNSCPFFKARAELEDADVIVANHDLVLSTLNSESTTLPDPEETLYVFDEAHHLPDKALSYHGSQQQLGLAIEWLQKSGGFVDKVISFFPSSMRNEANDDFSVQSTAEKLDKLINEFKSSICDLPDLQDYNKKRGQNPVLRFKHGLLPHSLLIQSDNLKKASLSHFNRLSSLTDRVHTLLADGHLDKGIAEQFLPELGKLLSRSENLFKTWSLFSEQDPKGEPPKARWIEARVRNNLPDFLVAGSAITADVYLNDLIWNRASGVVMTSATMMASGTFDRFSSKAGLNLQPMTTYLELQSPFDFQTNAVLNIPAMSSLPADRDKHTQEVIQYLNNSTDPSTSTLVLFTSYWQMNAVFEKLDPSLKALVIKQGDVSKNKMLEMHKQRIDSGKGSILFGTDSLSEGVDLPGDYLLNLVVTKLPFSVPTDPVSEATAEWMESVGLNPFLQMAVPDASTKLVQAVGRLIRTETDKGTVTILDRRLLVKRYGQSLINDLPPMRRDF